MQAMEEFCFISVLRWETHLLVCRLKERVPLREIDYFI